MGRCLLFPPSPSPDDETLALLAGIPTAPLSDSHNRDGCIRGLKPIATMELGDTVAGRALTVKTRPGDNLAVHQAAELAEPGDFLVIDGGGSTDRAVLGMNTCSYIASRGVVAIALNGVARDVAELRGLEIPVFALGTTFVAPLKSGPGEIRGPLAIGGTVIRQGDYVIGDADGVVVIPQTKGRAVAEAARQAMAGDEVTLREIAAGTFDRSWLADAVELIEVDQHGQIVH